MGNKWILLADNESRVAEEFRQALGDMWQVTAVDCGTAALDALKSREYDVLVASLDMPDMDGAELLNQARKKYPQLVRFVLAKEADKTRVMKEVLGAHQFLAKPLDRSALKSTIERAMALDVWIASESMRTLVSKVRTFPTLPTVYLELLNALRSPNATTEEIGAIVTKDMAITTKLLQVLNSAYFGLPNKITDPAEAVGILGFETLKSMVVAVKLLGHYDRLKPVYFSIDQMWRHSTDVARSAKQLVMMHTGIRKQAEMAFTAGLLHDMGKVILAANFDEQYRGAHSLAAKQGMPLWDVEKEIFGATHGEIGAYLLGLWGMPLDLMEAAALHHYPSRSNNREFTALTAVHVANALEYEVSANKQDTQVPIIDEEYLVECGLIECLPSWREAVTTRNFSIPETRVRRSPAPAAPVAPAKSPAASAEEKPGADVIALPSSTATEPKSRKKWAFAAAACAVVVGIGAVALVSKSKPAPAPASEESRSPVPANESVLPVRARASTTQNAPRAEETPRVAEPAKAAATELKPTPAVPAQPVVAAPQPAAPAPEPVQPKFPDLRLQGLMLTAAHPSAIVNGKMMQLNDVLLGARLVEIGRSNATFEFNKERRTLKLK